MRDPRLLWSGLTLLAVAVLGTILTAGSLPGRVGWVDSMGSHHQMMWPWQDGDAATEPIPDATELILDAAEFGFSPTTITVNEDVPVNLTLVNTGSLIHDLTIPELGFRIIAAAGESATGGFVPDLPGTYGLECSIPGHAQAGMTGTLIVTAAP